MNLIRKRIRFTGSVQGVGFRWRARHAAELAGCTGWCRNEWDGSVLMEIQGEGSGIDRVLLALRTGRFIDIDTMEAVTIPVIPEHGFRTE